MNDEEIRKRFDDLDKAVSDTSSCSCGGGTAIMVFIMFLTFLMHGCDFK